MFISEETVLVHVSKAAPQDRPRSRREVAALDLRLGSCQPGAPTTLIPLEEVPVMPQIQNGRFMADLSLLADEVIVFLIGIRKSCFLGENHVLGHRPDSLRDRGL